MKSELPGAAEEPALPGNRCGDIARVVYIAYKPHCQSLNCRLSGFITCPYRAPFFGINRGTGGVILFATEKLRSFKAKPIRPREST